MQVTQNIKKFKSSRLKLLFKKDVLKLWEITQDNNRWTFLLVWNQTGLFLTEKFSKPWEQQKAPTEVFCKKRVFKNFADFTGKYLRWSLFLIKLQACNIIKKRLQCRCFLVEISKFLRIPFLKNICDQILLEQLFWGTFLWLLLEVPQPAFTYSNSSIEASGQCVKSVQS